VHSLLSTPDQHWFVEGGAAPSLSEWQHHIRDCAIFGRAVEFQLIRVTWERAAEILIQGGFEKDLPADLAAMVRTIATGGNPPSTQPETAARPADVQTEAPPEQQVTPPSGNALTPAGKAAAAAYELRRLGEPISLRAVCERAGVDRGNLRKRHPETVQMIKEMATPDRAPKRGTHDHRTEDDHLGTGDIDAVDDAAGPQELAEAKDDPEFLIRRLKTDSKYRDSIQKEYLEDVDTRAKIDVIARNEKAEYLAMELDQRIAELAVWKATRERSD
jgi:hypothetical protein